MARILILYATAGVRHTRAASALARAFALRPPAEAWVDDALSRANLLFRQAYQQLSDRAPTLVSYAYDRADRPDWPIVAELRDLVERYGGLEHYVQRHRPDALICTHFLPTYMLARARRRGRLSQPLHCVVTDFAGHAFWVHEGVDAYFVPSDDVRRQLAAHGAPPERVHVTGFPVDPLLAWPADRSAARRALGLAEGPLVTLVAQKLDRQPLLAASERMLHDPALAGTLAVLAGRSRTLQRRLRRLAEQARAGREPGDGGLALRVFSTAEPDAALLAASDLLIGKPSGQLIAEALARGVPLLLADPSPGQQEWNADYVVSLGAGEQLRLLFASPRLAAMATRARAAGRPTAALTIADAVLAGLAPELARSLNGTGLPSLT
jgi:processive 1,2-diacylglycerol beta-glucosyltransferase